jgi:hypothetical protein
MKTAPRNDLVDAVLENQKTYATILKPLLAAVREMNEAALLCPQSKEHAAKELLCEFGSKVVAITNAGEFQGLRSLCDEYVGYFRRLAGN